jgi:hypothetical protein
MKKVNVLWIILDLIFLVIFNVMFFIIGGFEHNASVWLSYAFIHFAYFMLLLTPLFIRKNKFPTVLGFPLYSISTIYFFVEFVVGIVFILIAPESINIALLVQLCIAGLYGIVLIANMIANEHTVEAVEKRQKEISYIKDASIKMKKLLDFVTDKELKKKVEKIYDEISSSPIKSHPDLELRESQIFNSIGELESEISAGNNENIIIISDKLLALIKERNIELKASN